MSDLKQARDEFEDYLGWKPPRWKSDCNGGTYYEPSMESRWQDFLQGWNRRTQPEATAPAPEPEFICEITEGTVRINPYGDKPIISGKRTYTVNIPAAQDLSAAIDKDAKIAAQRARIMEMEEQLARALGTPVNDWCPECHARESSGDALSAGDRVDAELLQKLRHYVDAKSQDYGYGFYRPANPHDFTPDADQCSEDEIAAHKAACEAFDKGEYTHDHSGCIQGGGMHILHAPWGIGSYVMRDEESEALLTALNAAILQSQKGGSDE